VIVSLVFAAQAGMIPILTTYKSTVVSIPRASGDDPETDSNWEDANVYSPRKRG